MQRAPTVEDVEGSTIVKIAGWLTTVAVLAAVAFLTYQYTQQNPSRSSSFTHTYCQQTQRCR